MNRYMIGAYGLGAMRRTYPRVPSRTASYVPRTMSSRTTSTTPRTTNTPRPRDTTASPSSGPFKLGDVNAQTGQPLTQAQINTLNAFAGALGNYEQQHGTTSTLNVLNAMQQASVGPPPSPTGFTGAKPANPVATATPDGKGGVIITPINPPPGGSGTTPQGTTPPSGTPPQGTPPAYSPPDPNHPGFLMNGQPDPNYNPQYPPYGGAGTGGGGGGGGYGGGAGDYGGGGGDPGDPGNIDWGDSGDAGLVPEDDSSVNPDAMPDDDSSDGSDDGVILGGDYMIGAYAIGATIVPSAGANYDDDAKTVVAVQNALKQKGYDPGPLDGVYGSKTKKAIKAMQKDAGLDTTGVIDEGVVSALQVTPGVLPPGVSLRDKSLVQAQVALDAATLAEHAQTPGDVQTAAQQVQAVADAAAPPLPPDVQQKVTHAVQRARTATTPAEAQAAAAEVASAARDAHASVAPSLWSQPAWSGAPLKRWQAVAASAAGVSVIAALGLLVRRR